MLFILLIVSIMGNVILFWKLSNMEIKYLGETSSFKLEIKKKNEEIEILRKKIKQFKTNTDVQV